MPRAGVLPDPVELPLEELAVPDDLFIVADGPAYLLYSPQTLGVARVNGVAARQLREVRAGLTRLDSLPPDVLDALVGAGILIGRDQASRTPSIPSKTAYDPSGMTLTLTTRCTLACTYCYANGGDRPRVMRWETAKAALDWLVRHAAATGRTQVSVMFHGGGEVTTARTLLQRCVAYGRSEAQARGLTFNTSAGLNGVMKGPLVEWVIKNIDSATVSLDGLPEVHDAQRPLVTGRASFPVIAAALHRMDECGYDYGLRATVTRLSLERLVESVDFMCRTFRARMIHLEPVFQVGRARVNDLGFPDPHEFVTAFRAAREVTRAYGRELKYSGARFGTITNKFCQVCDDLLAITPDGRVTACYEVGELDDPRAETFFYGRLDAETGEIEVDHDKVRRLRTLTVDNKPSCADCFCKWSCAGECASKLALAGDPWDTTGSPRCIVNRELTLDQMREYLAQGGRTAQAREQPAMG